mmetsp:Transcript_8032/g.6261  ORF Transcript_8032/g.6261 Transcript_8032/m.6261 type:complete len:90 (-) Transcript_8032:132-401(-)
MSEAKPPTEDDLAKKKGSLKPGETKESDILSLDPAAVAAMEKLYTEKGGDIAALAAAVDVDAALLGGKHKPTDATDFARKLLMGKYAAA